MAQEPNKEIPNHVTETVRDPVTGELKESGSEMSTPETVASENE